MSYSLPKKKREPFYSKFIHLADEFNLNPQELTQMLLNYQDKYQNAVEHLSKQSNNFSKEIVDDRSLSEYMYDLCEGWIVEDILSYALNSELKKIGKYKLTLQGNEITNQGRKIFFTSKKVSSKADIEIQSENKSLKVELQFTNKERRSYDIKETKIRQAKKEKGLIVVYSLPIKKAFIIDTETDLQYGQALYNAEWGGKLSYNFKTENINKFLGFKNIKEIARTIVDKMEIKC